MTCLINVYALGLKPRIVSTFEGNFGCIAKCTALYAHIEFIPNYTKHTITYTNNRNIPLAVLKRLQNKKKMLLPKVV